MLGGCDSGQQKFPFTVTECFKDVQGQYVKVTGSLFGQNISFLNLYCLPGNSPEFPSRTFSEFAELASDNLFIAGDFNCILSPHVDKRSVHGISASKQAKILSSICQYLGYTDVWRVLHPTDLEFTFFSSPHRSYSRLAYIFVPSYNMSQVVSCSIGSIVLSDHAPVYMVYSLKIEG